MAWRGRRTTTGRGGSGIIGGKRDTDPARDNGDCLDTSRRARLTDRCEVGAAGHPGAGVQGREKAATGSGIQNFPP